MGKQKSFYKFKVTKNTYRYWNSRKQSKLINLETILNNLGSFSTQSLLREYLEVYIPLSFRSSNRFFLRTLLWGLSWTEHNLAITISGWKARKQTGGKFIYFDISNTNDIHLFIDVRTRNRPTAQYMLFKSA